MTARAEARQLAVLTNVAPVYGAVKHRAAKTYAMMVALADGMAPLTVPTILDLHRLVTDHILDEPGQLRRGAVSIRGSLLVPPPAREVPGLLEQWVAWLTGEGLQYEPVTRAAIAHHGFLAVHPFIDGNGRTARLLLNLLLLRSGYPPALLLQEWRLGYLEGLAQADRGRYGPLLNLLGRAVEGGLDLYLEACAAVPADEWLPLSELAQGTRHSAAYLALLVRKGRLAASKRGGRWHSTRAALARYEAEVAAGSISRGRPPSHRL